MTHPLQWSKTIVKGKQHAEAYNQSDTRNAPIEINGAHQHTSQRQCRKVHAEGHRVPEEGLGAGAGLRL